MRSTLDELAKELGDLRALAASIAPVNSVLSGHEDSVVRRFVVLRRRFDYAAFAVALYACLEKFIENLAAASASLEARRLAYADLPTSLRKKHLSRTAEILSRGRLGEGRYAGLAELDLVKNLFECLSGAHPYRLNESAVIAHDLNLRAREIDAVFLAVGIERLCDRVRHADALLAWYRDTQQPGAPPEGGVPGRTIEERLEDIVERRNQVAHRGGNPDDLLGADGMLDAIRFVDAFARSVLAIAVGRYLEGKYATKGMRLIQRQDDGPYRKGTVVVVEPPTWRIFLGQPVFVVASNGARWGRVRSIKVNERGVDTVEPGAPVSNGVGIELNFICPKGAPLFAIAADDDVVWSPD